MPVIPDIPISDRKVGGLPSTYVARIPPDRTGDIIASGVNSIGNSLSHSVGVFADSLINAKRMRVNRDADYLLAQWKDHTRKGIYGDIQNNNDGTTTQVKGINQKQWTDYAGTESNALTDLAGIERDWEDTYEYKTASPEAIELFKKKSQPYRQTFIESVNGMHDRNVKAKMVYERNAMNASDDRDVYMASSLDNESFSTVAGRSALMKTCRDMMPLIRNPDVLNDPNGCTPDQIEIVPEYQKLFNEKYKDYLYKYNLDRVTALTQSAAKGESLIDGTTAEQSIVKAYQSIDQLSEELKGKDVIDPEQIKALKGVVKNAETSLKYVRGKQAKTYFTDSMDILKKQLPTPPETDLEGTNNYNENMAMGIERVLQDPIMSYDPNSVAVGQALIRSYRVKAGWSVQKIRQRQNMETADRAIGLGVAVDSNGTLISMESERVRQMADSLLKKGEIDHKGWEDFYSRADRMADDESIEIAKRGLTAVMSGKMLKKIGVTCNEKGDLTLTPSTIQFGQEQIGGDFDEWKYYDYDAKKRKRIEKEEDLTVNKMLDILNATIRDGRSTGRSGDQIVDTFVKVVQRDVAHLKHLSIQQTVENMNRVTAAFAPTVYFGQQGDVSFMQPLAGRYAPQQPEQKKTENKQQQKEGK